MKEGRYTDVSNTALLEDLQLSHRKEEVYMIYFLFIYLNDISLGYINQCFYGSYCTVKMKKIYEINSWKIAVFIAQLSTDGIILEIDLTSDCGCFQYIYIKSIDKFLSLLWLNIFRFDLIWFPFLWNDRKFRKIRIRYFMCIRQLGHPFLFLWNDGKFSKPEFLHPVESVNCAAQYRRNHS